VLNTSTLAHRCRRGASTPSYTDTISSIVERLLILLEVVVAPLLRRAALILSRVAAGGTAIIVLALMLTFAGSSGCQFGIAELRAAIDVLAHHLLLSAIGKLSRIRLVRLRSHPRLPILHQVAYRGAVFGIGPVAREVPALAKGGHWVGNGEAALRLFQDAQKRI
jgi:hypothetical protein